MLGACLSSPLSEAKRSWRTSSPSTQHQEGYRLVLGTAVRGDGSSLLSLLASAQKPHVDRQRKRADRAERAAAIRAKRAAALAPRKDASNAPAAGQRVYSERRDARVQLKEDLRDFRTRDRQARCGRSVIQGAAHVVKSHDGTAHLAGVETCGSVWSCPTCAPKIRAERAKELERFATGWIRLDKGLVMATFTVRHHSHERLSEQMAGLALAWRRMTAGRPWASLKSRFGVAGYTKAEEVTYGANGWHPHFHVLLWLDSAASDSTAEQLEGEIYALWSRWVVEVGLGEPTRKHGVDVKAVHRGEGGARDIARYVAKVQGDAGVERSMGNEMMRGDLKASRLAGSRMPFQIAQDGVDQVVKDGDMADLVLWQEFERATYNRRALTWSRGLKALLCELLEMQEDARTDEEIAAQEVGGDVVASFPRESWYRHVASHRGRTVAVLRAAEKFGTEGIISLAEQWGMEWGKDALLPTPDSEE